MRRFTVGHRRCGPSRLLLGLLLVPLVVLLSSCVRYQSSIDIKSKDDITVNVDVAMQTSSLGLGGMPTSPEEFCQDISSSAGPKITITPYADDAYTGCRITAAGSLDDGVISNAGMGDTLQLVDGVWVYRSAPGDLGSVTGMMFDSFRVDVTFPGEVLTHNGSSTVSNRTVTWTSPNDLLSAEGLHATGKDRDPVLALLPWILAGVAASVLVVAVVLVSRRRSRRAGVAPPHSRYQQPYPGAMQQYQPGAPWDQGRPGTFGVPPGQLPYYGPGPTPANMAYPPGQPQGPYPPGQPQGPYPPGPGVPGPTAQWGSPHEPEPTLPLPDEPPSGWVMPPRPPAPGAGPRS